MSTTLRVHVAGVLITMTLPLVAVGAWDAPPASGRLIRVRPADRQIATLMNAGYRTSPTFRQLVDALEHSDIIVYVAASRHLPGTDLGQMHFVCRRGHQRYLRVSIRTLLSPTEFLSTVAHELQHALEVAASLDVIDAASMAALYERIGRPSCNGFETAAARRTGELVSSELERYASTQLR